MLTGLLVTQALNGLQLGVLLFLLAAGLTLVFGIMNFVNLAHGSLYMMGAYFAAVATSLDRFVPARCADRGAGDGAARASRRALALKRLYRRDHLDQVLATFGLILFFNELVRIIWGPVARLHECTRLAVGHGQSVRLRLLRVPLRDHRRRSARWRPACTG